MMNRIHTKFTEVKLVCICKEVVYSWRIGQI